MSCAKSQCLPYQLGSLMELLQMFVSEYVVKALRLRTSISKLELANIFNDAEHRQMLRRQLIELAKMCVQGELPMTKITVDHVLSCLNDFDDQKHSPAEKDMLAKSLSGELLMQYLMRINDRLSDELSTKLFFQLPHSRKEVFELPRKKWEQVIDRFPDTTMDIEESARCFALSRYAAAVFHSIQVVEFGLIELGTFIKVNDPLSGWTAVTGRLEKIVLKTPYSDRTPFERDNFGFLEQVHGTVVAMKNAWRNKISHAQGRLALMTADFSPDVAEEIMMATRSFMRRLATDLPRSQ